MLGLDYKFTVLSAWEVKLRGQPTTITLYISQHRQMFKLCMSKYGGTLCDALHDANYFQSRACISVNNSLIKNIWSFPALQMEYKTEIPFTQLPKGLVAQTEEQYWADNSCYYSSQLFDRKANHLSKNRTRQHFITSTWSSLN